MKNGWPKTTLGDLCVLTSGGTPSKTNPHFWVGDVPFVSARDLKSDRINTALLHISREAVEESATKLASVGSLLMLVRGMGLANGIQIGEVTAPVAFNQDIRALSPPLDSVLPRFLLLALKNTFMNGEGERVLSSAAHGTLKIDTDVLRQISVPMPPLSEQRRVVGILDEAFSGIATAKANAEKNLQNARALFESHLQAVFTQHGEGWKMEKLDALTKLARGHNPPKSKFSREEKPGYVRFYQIRDGGTDDYAVYVPDTPQLHKMKKDDIMMVAYRHVGRAFRGVEGAFNVALCKISNARRDLLDDDYLFHMIPSQFVKGELLKRSERSLIPSMSIEHLRELMIPLPPLREQQRIVELISCLSTETQRLESLYQRKLAALDELKKSLLHRALSGEL